MAGRTKLQLAADRRTIEMRRAIGNDFRSNREDQGATQAAVSDGAGIDRAHLARIEVGQTDASLEVLERVAAALGGEMSVRFYPGTGSALRDRFQAAIIESILKGLHPVWKPSLEVAVHRPARGVIDLVLLRTDQPLVVASEVHSQIRRLEQTVRWGNLKRESLPSADLWRFVAADAPPDTSALLVLRSTEATRSVVREHEATLASLFPAPAATAFDSLTTGTPWPGSALLWADVGGGVATIRRTPPRGIRVGR